MAKPCGLRLLNLKLEGRPLTVKNIPSPWLGLVGGCGFGGKGCFETLGKPRVVTTKAAGIPTNIVALLLLVICGAS